MLRAVSFLRLLRPPRPATTAFVRHVRASPASPTPSQVRPPEDNVAATAEVEVTAAEARRLVRLVGVETLKRRLRDGREVVGCGELLDSCVAAGAARTRAEATTLARSMDDAGVVLLFRDKAYLRPEKVADLVSRSVPLELENDPSREELRRLQAKLEEIDRLAHRHVQFDLWSGLATSVLLNGAFIRLTCDLSWDFMEPIASFVTAAFLLTSFAYFIVTCREPTYRAFMKWLFLAKRRKICAWRRFDMERYLELQKQFRCSLKEQHGSNVHSFNGSVRNQERPSLKLWPDSVTNSDLVWEVSSRTRLFLWFRLPTFAKRVTRNVFLWVKGPCRSILFSPPSNIVAQSPQKKVFKKKYGYKRIFFW